MIKIIGLPSESVKKFNLFGVDFSIAYAKLWQSHRLVPVDKLVWVTGTKNIFYSFDSEEKYATITHRLILWRFKLEVKTIVQRHMVYA